MSILTPFQLLELNVISAQELVPISRAMRTYAVAWVHQDHKLSTQVDTQGHNNPTWNDKFVFRVNEDFLHEDTSAVMIEIYALHWFRDVHVGTIRVLVGNLIPTPAKPHQHHPQVGMRFVALQVRRPSGRPQGILNIGVALLHSSMRSMPLYSQLSASAVGYKQLMGEDDHQTYRSVSTFSKPELRRSKSDCSSMLGSDKRAKEFRKKDKKGKSMSVVSSSDASSRKHKKGRSKASSMINDSEIIRHMGRKGKASSVVSASELNRARDNNVKPSSILSISDVAPKFGGKDKKEKPSSILRASDPKIGSEPDDLVRKLRPNWNFKPGIAHDFVAASPLSKASKKNAGESYENTPARRSSVPGKSPFKMGSYDQYMTPRKSNLMAAPYLTESELGPSPSEVAATIARERVDQDNESSVVVGAWNEDESAEGLQSKLERWRTEMPPMYDRGDYSSFQSSSTRHTRRHTDGGAIPGLFSCFSNICGVECSIVCGGGEASKNRNKGGSSKASTRVESMDNMSKSYV